MVKLLFSCLMITILFFIPCQNPVFGQLQSEFDQLPVPDVIEPRPEADEPPGDGMLNRIFAHVGNRVISLADYRESYGTSKLEENKLRSLIEEKLLLLALDELEIQLDQREIERVIKDQVEQMKNAVGTAEFSRYLNQQGISKEDFTRLLVEQTISQQKLQTVLVTVFPELRPADTPTVGSRPSKIRGRLMLFPDQQMADTAYRQLDREKNWRKVFNEYSRKLAFMGDYGDLGWFAWGNYAEEMEYTLFKLPLYGISQPFEFRGFYAIVQKTGTRLIPPWTEVDMRTLQRWEQYRFQHHKEKLLAKLWEHYKVKIPASLEIDLQPPR